MNNTEEIIQAFNEGIKNEDNDRDRFKNEELEFGVLDFRIMTLKLKVDKMTLREKVIEDQANWLLYVSAKNPCVDPLLLSKIMDEHRAFRSLFETDFSIALCKKNIEFAGYAY
jgi:hypothetical protein